MISAAILERTSPNVLVYGTGNDSEYWFQLNRRGRTQFLEDDLHWVEQASRVVPHLAIDVIRYETVRTQWRALLEDPTPLGHGVPEVAKNVRWDVIIVDAPRGHEDNAPGRMKSIYQAAMLANAGTDVFVHDCDREVEAAFCDRFMGNARFKAEVGRLRHYRYTA